MYPLLIGVFTLGLVCEPLLARLLKILQSTYRDYSFRRQMFKQDAFVKSLKANGWLLIPPDQAQVLETFDFELLQADLFKDNSKVLYDGETGYIDPRFLSSSPDDGWFEAGKGTQ